MTLNHIRVVGVFKVIGSRKRLETDSGTIRAEDHRVCFSKITL